MLHRGRVHLMALSVCLPSGWGHRLGQGGWDFPLWLDLPLQQPCRRDLPRDNHQLRWRVESQSKEPFVGDPVRASLFFPSYGCGAWNHIMFGNPTFSGDPGMCAGQMFFWFLFLSIFYFFFFFPPSIFVTTNHWVNRNNFIIYVAVSFSRGTNESIAEILKVFISPVRISVFTTLELGEKSHTSLEFCRTHCCFNGCLFVKIF